jgi:hypothetical protein
MRIFTLFSFLLLSAVAALAQPTVNFETGGAGAGYTWNVFENGNNPPLEIVANPSATGINTSTKVAKFTARADGQVYAGTENARGAFTTFDFSAANTTVKIMVYKSVISPVGLKFVSNGGAQPLKLVSNTKINEWEELTFDFSDLIPNAIPRDGTINIDQLNVFPDHRSGRVENVCYFDNITFSASSGGPPPSAPTTAATTPTRAAADVISLFSNAYTNRTINTWRTDWSNATLTDLQVAGNDTKRYTNLDFVGVEATGPNSINASSMLYFHVDAWTPNMTTFFVKLVDWGADNAFGGGDDKEHELSFTPTQGQWNGYDILLTEFTGLTTKSNISQIIFKGLPTASSTLFIDNVYFYTTVLAVSQTITFPAISDKTVGDAAFALTATASSNLPVAYSTDSDKVTISGSTATIVKAGRAVIKANQAGNSSFTAAPEVTRSFCIKPTKPSVTLTEPTAGTFLLTSSATAGNMWYKDGTLIASATNSTYSTTTAGIYKVQVTVDDCVSEFSADVPINVKGNQTITFPTITDKTVGNAPFSLTATASSTLAVAYSTDSDKVTISGSTVTIVKAGRVIVKANQAGNNSFNAAPEVTRSFCIKPAKPTVTATGTDVETITLTSSASTGNRWFLNGAAIPSATNATFSANQPGIYKVQVTVDDCVSEFSSDVPLIVTGDLAGNANAITVYPNPAQDYLELAGINGELSNVQLVDLAGRRNPIHFEKRGEVYQANVQHLTLGIYLLQVQDGAVIHRIKVIKK